MAGLKRCLGVDLGNSRVKIAEMAVDKAGLRLLRLMQIEVEIAPGTDEEERATRMAKGVRDLLKANKVATKDAVFAIPGQSVFQRIVKLPKTSEDRLRRIVEYEARQQIPFPLDQAHFEYQIFASKENPDEVEVLMVAIRRDHINQYLRVFRRTGLNIASIGVSSLALFDFHQLGREPEKPKAPDSGKKKKAAKKKPAKDKKAKGTGLFGKKDGKMVKSDEPDPADEEAGEDMDLDALGGEGDDLFGGDMFEEVKAYVNIGATTMDLAIAKNGGRSVGFCRSIPHAGNDMTRAIQDALELETFHEAEELKRTKAAALSSSMEEDVDYNIEASEALTRVIDRRIIGELRRSLDFYISQPDGVAVDAIVISGGQSALPFLDRYIEEKLGLPIERLDSVAGDRVKIPDAVKEGADFASGAIAISLAAQGLKATVIQIDFLPEELKTVREFKGRYIEVAVMVAALGAMIYFSLAAGKTKVTANRQGIQEVNRYVSNVGETNRVLGEFGKLETQRADAVGRFDNLYKLSPMPRDLWLQFWADLAREKPMTVTLDLVRMAENGNVILNGASPDLGAVSQFAENLKKRSDILTVVKSDISQRADPRFGANAYVFEIDVQHLKKKVRLKATPLPALATARTT